MIAPPDRSRTARKRRKAKAVSTLLRIAELGALTQRLDKQTAHYRITTRDRCRFDFWVGTQHWRSLDTPDRGDGIDTLLAAIGPDRRASCVAGSA